jgi:hypothetical protein
MKQTPPDPALAALFAELERSQKTFSSSPTEELNNPRQEGAIQAVGAVMSYLRAINVSLKLRAPLMALLSGLSDASEGRNNAIVQKAEWSKGKSRTKILDTFNMAAAAAAVTILKDDAKLPLKEAVGEIATKVGIKRSQLQEFRKNLGKGRASPEAIENYQFFLNAARSFKQFSAREQANRVIAASSSWNEKG